MTTSEKNKLARFGLSASDSEHAAIQQWRLNNPDGFILNMKSKTKGMLHGVDCDHFGDTSWEASAAGDLSKNVKYCSTDPDYLQAWAEENGIEVAYCSDCLEIVDEDEAPHDNAPAESFGASIATPEQFQAALLALRDKKQLTAEHLSILKHMASAPDKRTTATRMAKALNLATYAAANLRMGLFAHLLADELSYAPPKTGGRLMWWTTLASGLGGAPDSSDPHFHFIMRPELVEALGNMHWIKDKP